MPSKPSTPHCSGPPPLHRRSNFRLLPLYVPSSTPTNTPMRGARPRRHSPILHHGYLHHLQGCRTLCYLQGCKCPCPGYLCLALPLAVALGSHRHPNPTEVGVPCSHDEDLPCPHAWHTPAPQLQCAHAPAPPIPLQLSPALSSRKPTCTPPPPLTMLRLRSLILRRDGNWNIGNYGATRIIRWCGTNHTQMNLGGSAKVLAEIP